VELEIRAAKKSDFGAIPEIFDHPTVVAQSSQHPYLGIERISNLLDGKDDSLILLVAELEERIQGYICINLNTKPRAKHVASFGMAIHPNSHGKGIGSILLEETINMADNWLNIIRLELEVYTDNEHGIYLYKKFGFKVEGESKFASIKDGAYVGLYRMARIHPKFHQALRIDD